MFGPLSAVLGDTHAGVHAPKRSSPAAEMGHNPDGVAVFWNKARFAANAVRLFFGNPVRPRPSPSASAGARVFTRAAAQVQCVVELEELASKRKIIVSGLHLKAKPQNEAIRVVQIATALRRVTHVRAPCCAASPCLTLVVALLRWQAVEDSGAKAEILLCGDFNTEPTSETVAAVLQSDLKFASAYGSSLPWSTWKTRRYTL